MPSAPAVVSVDGVGKTYRVYARSIDRIAERLTRRPRHRVHHALHNVTFDVARGEGFGVIGENGAGKSTLLKILAGITTPGAGRVAVRGAAASILELGGGFHPDLTGRQNLALSAAMLGLSEREVRARTPEIIAFSELDAYIDEPVRVYSTGMAMRLAFAIAVQVEPDVLIVDEALSVGDGYFQRKCMRRIQDFLRGGGTLVFCSHAMYYVSEFCTRALWLRDGRVAALGPADAVIREYEAFLLARTAAAPRAPEADLPRGPARIVDVRQEGAAAPAAPLQQGDAWTLTLECASDDAGIGLHVAVGVDRIDGVQVFACSTRHDGVAALRGQTYYRVRLRVPALPLVQGQFTIYVFLLDEDGLQVYDRRTLAGALLVQAPAYRVGLMAVDHEWDADAALDREAPPMALRADDDQKRSLSPQV